MVTRCWQLAAATTTRPAAGRGPRFGACGGRRKSGESDDHDDPDDTVTATTVLTPDAVLLPTSKGSTQRSQL